MNEEDADVARFIDEGNPNCDNDYEEMVEHLRSKCAQVGDDFMADDPSYRKIVDDLQKKFGSSIVEKPNQRSPVVAQVRVTDALNMSNRELQFNNEALTVLNKEMPKVLAAAMKHSREVSNREHIKGTRFERVNIFITDLRREIASAGFASGVKKIVVGSLCRKEAWYDIGVINVGLIGRWGWYTSDSGEYISMHETNIRKWAGEAETLIPATDNLSDEIKKGLRDLDALVGGMDNQIKACQTINGEADNLMDKFCNLVENTNQ